MSSIHDGRPISTPDTKNDTREFSRIDLFNALESILWFWPEIFIRSAEKNQTSPDHMTLVRTVRLTGSLEGLVVFRSTPKLGVLMAQKLLRLETKEEIEAMAPDAFAEFVNVFCGYLMDKIREKNQTSFRHYLPLDLPREQWPTEPPHADLSVGVQDHLLEIHLWVLPENGAGSGGKP